MAHDLRCHHCKQWLGESSQPMEIVGMFKDPRQRDRITEPRDTWRCRACGWANVFHPVPSDREIRGNWRHVEIKRAS